MENMKKIVTAKDVAEAAGCSVSSVHSYFSRPDKVGSDLAERIQKACAELSYDPKATPNIGLMIGLAKRWGEKPTLKDVSDRCGLSEKTVNRVFSGNTKVSERNTQKILRAAEEIGFVYRPRVKDPEERKAKYAAKIKAEKERKFSIRYGGFKNVEEQTKYMETMRTMGYSNAQISRKVGLTHDAVIRRIGKQPDDMTKENRVAGAKHRAAENQRRKVYVDTHLVTTYNNMVVECAQLRSQASDLLHKSDNLIAEIKKMQPQVANAKLSTVKPAELPPEQIHMNEMVTASTMLQ